MSEVRTPAPPARSSSASTARRSSGRASTSAAPEQVGEEAVESGPRLQVPSRLGSEDVETLHPIRRGFGNPRDLLNKPQGPGRVGGVSEDRDPIFPDAQLGGGDEIDVFDPGRGGLRGEREVGLARDDGGEPGPPGESDRGRAGR